MPDISRTDQSNALPTRPLPGRDTPVLDMPFFHRVFGDRLDRHFEQGETIYLAMGCFWGAEKLFWQADGVLQTAVGFMGGSTPHPTFARCAPGRRGMPRPSG